MELKQSDRDEIMAWTLEQVQAVHPHDRFMAFQDWWGTFREWDVNVWMPWDTESVLVVSAYPLSLTWDDIDANGTPFVTIDGSLWYRVGEMNIREVE